MQLRRPSLPRLGARAVPAVRVGLALALLLATGCGGPARLDGAVLIVLDTLRADHVSASGHPRPTSPALDALAARGVLFENAVSNSSWTLPALSGLLSGRYLTRAVFDRGLRVSLVETLRDAGVHTAAFTEGAYASRQFGLDLGFERFEEVTGPVQVLGAGGAARPEQGGIEETFARAERWLREEARAPFFVMIHTYEVHTPYRRLDFAGGVPRGALPERFEIADMLRVREGELAVGETERAYLAHLYDGGVREADRHVGSLLETLDRLGLAGRTLIAVTSDHGEDFGGRDPRWAGDHGHTLYDEQLRIPLIWLDPRDPGPGRRVATQVRNLDVLPSIVEALGVAPPPGGEGRSFAPLLRGEERADRPLLARLFPRGGNGIGPTRTALRVDGRKLVVNLPFVEPAAPVVELYDLAADPAERDNRAEAESERGAREALTARMRERAESLARAGYPDLRPAAGDTEALRERLESLGYVE